MHSNNFQFSTRLGCLAAVSLGALISNPAHAQTTRLSNLSDGNFERQLQIPPTTPLESGSSLADEANKTYAQLPFSVGERMKFIVTYLGVSGGAAEVIIQPPVKHLDTWAHRITGEVKSARWYRWIMNIHDSIEGMAYKGGDFVPARFYINQQEGSYRNSKILEFDQSKGIVRQWAKRKDNDEVRLEFPLVDGTKDALGALYYLRTKLAATNPPPLNLNFPIFTSEKTWTGKADYLGSDTRKIGGKKYDTDVFRLVTTFGGLMEQKGDVKIWFSRDSRRLPLYIEASVKFGHIKVTMDEWDSGEAHRGQFEAIRHNL